MPEDASSRLVVGGFAPFSTCDWPGQLVATVFVAGCPWACPYCHNPHLRSASAEPSQSWRDALALLERRRGLLDGVVFSGGEPTTSAGLGDAIEDVTSLGMLVGLHTGGYDPARLEPLLGSVDWIGFDAKAPFAEYASVTGVAGSGDAVRRSLSAAVRSGVALEVRTTVHPSLLSASALGKLGAELIELGVSDWILQPYRATGVADPDALGPAPSEIPAAHVAAAAKAFPGVRIRT